MLDNIFLYWILILFRFLDLLDFLLDSYLVLIKKIRDIRTMANPPTLPATMSLQPPSDESLESLSEDIFSQGQSQSSADGGKVIAQAIGLKTSASVSMDPSPITSYYTDNRAMLRDFHLFLAAKGISPNVMWDDQLIRSFNQDPMKITEAFLSATAYGIQMSRQTSLDGPMKVTSDAMAIEVKKLVGMKLEFDSLIKKMGEQMTFKMDELRKELLSEISKMSVGGKKEPDFDEIRTKFLVKLNFPPTALSCVNFLEKIDRRFSYSRMKDLAESSISKETLEDYQKQCVAVLEELKAEARMKAATAQANMAGTSGVAPA
jgi:ribosomal protein L29